MNLYEATLIDRAKKHTYYADLNENGALSVVDHCDDHIDLAPEQTEQLFMLLLQYYGQH